MGVPSITLIIVFLISDMKVFFFFFNWNFHQLFPSVGITPLHHNDSYCLLRLLWNSQITLVNYRERVSYTYWLLKSLVQTWIVFTQWIFFSTQNYSLGNSWVVYNVKHLPREILFLVCLSRQRIEMQVKPAAFDPFKAYFICAVITLENCWRPRTFEHSLFKYITVNTIFACLDKRKD